MAYAVVNSLLQTLHLEDTLLRVRDNEQLVSLCEKFKYLQSFLEDSIRKHVEHQIMKDLEREIENVAKRAEDIIETHLYSLRCLGRSKKSRRKDFKAFQQDLMSVREEIKFIHEKVLRIRDNNPYPSYIRTGRYLIRSSTIQASNSENDIVGLDDDVVKVKDRLTGSIKKLEIITILGMGGIGKTTLARKVFDDPLIRYHFYVFAWITVSQGYQVRNMLIDLIRSVSQANIIYEKNEDSQQHRNVLRDGITRQTDQMLAEHLYRTLRGQRYLIVMDDVWDTEAWDDVKRSFPDDSIGSRIILTSRLTEVANYVNSTGNHHQMRFLSLDQGWELLKLKVFPKEECSVELDEVGKKIVEKCKGLPLAIAVVAGHLSKLAKERDAWLNVADDVGSLVSGNQKRFLNIFALSYNHLPHHLKACFLYLGAFPENICISAWRLTALWIAEGFLKHELIKGLEEVADECLEDLIDRNLVLVEKRINGRVITCRIHDMLRDFCLKEAGRTNFWHVIKRSDLPYPEEGSHYHRRLCAYSDIFPYVASEYSNQRVRTFVSSYRFSSQSDSAFSLMGFKLLRVLDIVSHYFHNFPIQVLKLIHLRYLGISTGGELPSAIPTNLKGTGKWCFMFSTRPEFYASISNLVNLQILIVNWGRRETHSLPSDIRTLTQLRHVRLNGAIVNFDDFFLAKTNGSETSMILHSLQTLVTVSSTNFSEKCAAVIPSLKKLGILVTERNDGQQPTDFLNHLSSLQYLVNLKLNFSIKNVKSLSISRWNAFPPNLKVLTLHDSCFPWEDMATIGTIPNLEVLKLKDHSFTGQAWQTFDGGFLQLKFLLLQNNDLKHWKSSAHHFPSLQHLVLRRCNALKEIPYGIGEIPTLQIIELDSCSPSSVCSAKRIQEAQQDDLEVHINLV